MSNAARIGINQPKALFLANEFPGEMDDMTNLFCRENNAIGVTGCARGGAARRELFLIWEHGAVVYGVIKNNGGLARHGFITHYPHFQIKTFILFFGHAIINERQRSRALCFHLKIDMVKTIRVNLCSRGDGMRGGIRWRVCPLRCAITPSRFLHGPQLG